MITRIKRGLLIALAVTFLVSGSSALASVITNAQYYGRIMNTASADITNAIGAILISVPDLVSLSMISADATDCAMQNASGQDIAFMPGNNATNPWIYLLGDMDENETKYSYVYTGEVTGGDLVYYPGSGGMSTDDHSSLELGNNFAVNLTDVYIDTTAGASKYIFYKSDALELYVDPSTSGTITLSLVSGSAQQEILRPNGAGYQTYITYANPAVAHYLNVDDETSDSDTTTVYESSSIDKYDYYNLTDTALSASTVIASVQASNRYKCSVATTFGYFSAGLRLGSTDNIPTHTYSTTQSYALLTNTVSRPGGGSWSVSDLNSLQIIIGLYEEGSGFVYSTQAYVTVNYYPIITVSLTDIPTGEHDIYFYADGSDLYLDIDGTSNSVSLSGASMKDNSSPWVSFENDTVTYAKSQEILVGGTQKQFIDWEYAETGDFQDTSGYDNDATPTFLTTGDVNLTENLSIFTAYSVNSGGVSAVPTTGLELLDGVPDDPGLTNQYPTGGGGFLGQGVLEDFAENSHIPALLLIYIVAFGSAVILGLIAYALTASTIKAGDFKRQLEGSLLVQSIVSLLVMVYFVTAGDGVIPGLALIPFGIEALVVMIWRITPSPLS